LSIKLDSSSSSHSWAATEIEVGVAELESQKLGAAAVGREGKLSLLLKGLERKGCH